MQRTVSVAETEPAPPSEEFEPGGVTEVVKASPDPYEANYNDVVADYNEGYFRKRFAELLSHETLFIRAYGGDCE